MSNPVKKLNTKQFISQIAQTVKLPKKKPLGRPSKKSIKVASAIVRTAIAKAKKTNFVHVGPPFPEVPCTTTVSHPDTKITWCQSGSKVNVKAELDSIKKLNKKWFEDPVHPGNPVTKSIESVAPEVILRLGIETELGKAAVSLALENIMLLDRKQKDYGPRNISDFGELGVLVRANDKVQRLRNLHGKAAIPANESILDSWRDLANYGLIGQMIRSGAWK